jgi:hypothetical protein
LIKLETYKERRQRNLTDLTNYNFDNLWDTTGQLFQVIKEIADALSELGAVKTRDPHPMGTEKLAINGKGLEFVLRPFRLVFMGAPVDESPYYSINVNGCFGCSYEIDRGQTTQVFIDSLARLIDRLRDEVFVTEQPQFLALEFLTKARVEHIKRPTAETYRLMKLLKKHYLEELDRWETKRKEHNRKKKDAYEKLCRLKNMLPHSINQVRALKGRIFERPGRYYGGYIPLPSGEVEEVFHEATPYLVASRLMAKVS